MSVETEFVKLRGFHHKLFLTRYAKKSLDKKKYIMPGATVITLTKDGKYPVREVATVQEVTSDHVIMTLVTADGVDHQVGDTFIQNINHVDALVETEWYETARRIAYALGSVEATEEIKNAVTEIFLDIVGNFQFVPSGRIMTGAGDDALVTLFNCYVQAIRPPKGMEHVGADSRQAIFHTMSRIAEIMARGGGNGTNLDVLRPRYAPLSQTKGKSAGAVETGNMFSSLTQWVEQGNRRGAQMLTLSVKHPDCYYTNDESNPDYNHDFIGAKNRPGFMEGNNSSVLITDDFMYAKEHDLDWNFVFPDTSHPRYNELWDGDYVKWESLGLPLVVYRTVKARDVWDKLMYCNWKSAEPGILFIDRINRDHNGWYLGRVSATNPCGEQPILPNSTCNLGAVNWGRMIKEVGRDELGPIYKIDWELFEKAVRAGTRFLDNAIDLTFYFDEEMKHWQQGERRLGLGLMGLADLLIALRLRYGSPEGNAVVEEMIRFQRDTAYDESVNLAIEKGPFPFFDCDKFMESGFVKRLPDKLKARIYEHGIRNLTLLTIAPTGTTGSVTPSLLDVNGSVSTGCEPHFAMKYNRMSRIGNTVQYAGVAKAWMDEHPGMDLPDYFVGAMDLTPEEHVAVQSVLQKYVCSSISKTVNVPGDYTVEDCQKVYELAYEMGLKGCTIYRDGSRYEQILTLTNDSDEPKAEELPVIEAPKKKNKYESWTCPNCGSTEFKIIENCPQCDKCGTQTCSI